MRICLVKPAGAKLTADPVFATHIRDNALVRASGVNIFFCPNLACLNVAAMLPPGCEAVYVDEEVAAPFDPGGGWDLVHVSPVATYQVTRGHAIAAVAREAGAHVSTGGIHASMLPDEALRHFDTVLAGEEEALFPAFLSDLMAGRPKGLYRSAELFDLERLPLPRYDLAPMANYRMIHVQASRGCPVGCDFCNATHFFGAKLRHKRVAQVLDELAFIRRLSGRLPPLHLFSDDNMFVDRAYARELLAALVPLGLRFSCYSDISVADDPDILRLAARAGCYEMVIGLESLDDGALRTISEFKRRHARKYAASIAAIQEAGIGVSGSFIVGYDEDDDATFERLAEFILANRLYEVSVSALTPLPGTEVYFRLRGEGRILTENWEEYTTWAVVFRPRNFTPEGLSARIAGLYARIFSRERLVERARHFKAIQRRRLEREP